MCILHNSYKSTENREN